MYLNRFIDDVLLDWTESPVRKPLLLRGARQVGKTESVRHLGSRFESFVEVNFEREPEVKVLFERGLSPGQLVENLSVYTGRAIVPGRTLLFFDEIQACPDAIRSLRFFYEELSALHVIAAGSLLEFALAGLPSYGVGRIRYVYMYPLSFDEFLAAVDSSEIVEMKQAASPEAPLTEPVHLKLRDHLIRFIALGGLPEVVTTYMKTRDVNHCVQVQNDLILTLQDDFAKYNERVPASRLVQIFQTIIQQAGSKFVYARVADDLNHRQIREAIQLLMMAGLVLPVTYTSAHAVPLSTGINPRYQKLLLYDTGIAMRMLRFDIGDMLVDTRWDVVNKGALAEQFTGLEFLKYADPYMPAQLYYWQRQTAGSQAEIDYLIEHDDHILPVEVKSGGRGTMQSLHLFMKEKHVSTGVRISLENFSKYNGIRVYPLYAVSGLM